MEVRFFGADIVVDDIEGISEAYCRNGAPDLSCVFLDVLFTFCFANVFLVLLNLLMNKSTCVSSNKNTCVLVGPEHTCSCSTSMHVFSCNEATCALVQQGYMCSCSESIHVFLSDENTCIIVLQEYM